MHDMDNCTFPEPLNLDDAVAHATAVAREILEADGLPDNANVEIVLWGEEAFGPRVAEVSYDFHGSIGWAGGSWMQMDPPCYPVVYTAERFIVTLMSPEIDGPYGVESAEEAFRSALTAPATV